ncbi:hypothetical protein [Rathayibacter rathayi]|uniref:WXG100 family type VII secretion target n=1 Tax=Rathayibacter rathayi TaxID=33887 RepID=A0ABD6W5S1_RATRA|nr:hypothetical protein [Rathayibacter rathayi]MWV76034.1 hypothetical protein [Rathayibacter rathayi NCPPB 2980 = VKM Ac-1601]PPF10255.1 hypothetical protein C5C04_13560 [Rathayibacter rathayi]PPF43018.1 hypothetical protein C5C08_14390 [Rathayibacter rathayi]PPG10225.1 hypothetical protein C5C11_14335 [Rathayibacter rathayi]PPG36745.1 hypothetical protein C5C20_14955 [Rathayibacter rathayi]
MNDERALAQVQELDEVIAQLNTVRSTVQAFRVDDYKDAGGAQWAGQGRTRFTASVDTAKSNFEQISEQIEQAISDCKSKQRTLAFSINPLEHPALSVQAVAIALN